MNEPPPEKIYSVSRLVGEIRARLEGDYGEVWVEGEVSGLATPASGHRYFALAEGDALIRCALFKGTAAGVTDGMHALVRGRVTVFAPRGDMQLIVSRVVDAGEGALQRAAEALKRKLAAEGLFDERHKKTLPVRPRAVGVVSSDSGAALHDIRVTLKRRYPLARLIIYPTPVQGAGAVAGVVEMLRVANRRREVDALIVARGGGSAEDLQAFNDEAVARAVFASRLPVVSAVGHEIDFTIADLAADVRAATPTAAAELVAPDIGQLRRDLRDAASALQHCAQQTVNALGQRHDFVAARLTHPLQRLDAAEQSQRALTDTMKLIARNRVAAATQTADHLAEQLAVMSPAETLSRGYAILQDDRNRVVTDPAATRPNQPLTATVKHGKLNLRVE